MHNEKMKITDNEKMRLHYRKRSDKPKAKNFETPPVHEQIETQNSTDSEKKKYKDTLEYEVSDGKFYAGVKKSSGKTVMIDPAFEKRRKYIRRIEKISIYSLIAVVIIIITAVAVNYIATSSRGQKIIDNMNKDKHITEHGNYIFGEFDGYVTIGTPIEEAVEILGLPTPGSDNQYFYGKSYIIVEEDTVVGYHKDKSDYFLVTIGYKDADINPVISIGDSAKRVVSKLGSPETYHKYKWTYVDMNQNFQKNNYYSGNAFDLIISFNTNYEVTGYEFVQ